MSAGRATLTARYPESLGPALATNSSGVQARPTFGRHLFSTFVTRQVSARSVSPSARTKQVAHRRPLIVQQALPKTSLESVVENVRNKESKWSLQGLPKTVVFCKGRAMKADEERAYRTSCR